MRKLIVLLLAAFAATTYGATVDVCATAVCDGSTNDASAINTLISAASSGDVLEVDGMAGIGAGGIVVNGKTNITIRCLGIGSNTGFKSLAAHTQATSAHSGFTMTKVTGTTDVTIEGCEFDLNSVGGTGVEIYNSTRPRFLRNEVHHGDYTNPSAALVTSGVNTDPAFVGNIVHDSTGTAGQEQRGMWLGNAGGNIDTRPVISHNWIYNIAHTCLPIQATDSYATGNVMDNCGTVAGSAGIKFAANAGDTGFAIFNGNICRGGDHCIQLDAELTPVTVKGMYAYGDGSAHSALYISGGDLGNGLTFEDSYMTNYGSAGITAAMQGNTTPMTFRNLVFDGVGTSNNFITLGGDGLLTSGVVGPVIFDRIYINDTDDVGLLLRTSGGTIDNVTVTNSVFRSSTYGIYIDVVSGNITNFSSLGAGNCFISNGTNLFDSRSIIANPGSSGSCTYTSTSQRPAVILGAL